MRFRAASDQAMLVYLGDEISQSVNARVVKLLRLLQTETPKWLRNLQPAYCSLLISFDACQVDHEQVETAIRKYEQRVESASQPASRRVEIPVCYGAEFGPDLQDVAAMHGLPPQRVVELHAQSIFRAYFLGFAPGFAYLGELPVELDTPRLATPRKQVAAGSVGIAGRQTGVYPFDSPGGWRILGRTPVSMFAANRKPMEMVSVSDEVQFFPISPEQFGNWKTS